MARIDTWLMFCVMAMLIVRRCRPETVWIGDPAVVHSIHMHVERRRRGERMKMTGEERIGAPRGRVWEALNDPEILRQCIPGCQSLQKEGTDKLLAVVEVKLGPIGARFNGSVTVSDVNAPQSYTLTGEGNGGTVGSARTSIKVRLTEDGAATVLSYQVDAQVGGRLAQLGGPLIDATAKRFASQFFKKLGEVVGSAEAAPAVRANTTSSTTTSAARAPAPIAAPAPAAPAGFPIAWILALVVAALTGFLIGRGQSGADGSDWMGLAIGLLVVIVAAAGFEFGRRTASTQIVLDAASLQRLLRGEN
jgi:carbon monoxide dehydrogenase subunit G